MTFANKNLLQSGDFILLVLLMHFQYHITSFRS